MCRLLAALSRLPVRYALSVTTSARPLAAQRGEVVRAEPFDAIELFVGVLFGDDEPEPV